MIRIKVDLFTLLDHTYDPKDKFTQLYSRFYSGIPTFNKFIYKLRILI